MYTPKGFILEPTCLGISEALLVVSLLSEYLPPTNALIWPVDLSMTTLDDCGCLIPTSFIV